MANDFPKHQMEILIVDGGSSDGTRDVAKAYSLRYPFIRLLDNPRRKTPVALNIGIRASVGDPILRMDAHATYAEDYIASCVRALEEHDVWNVGGIMQTLPREDTLIGHAIVAVLGHPFGVGNSQFRVHPREPTWVDTVFGGCYRRCVFQKIGLFNERLDRGQDMEFNKRVKAAGGRTLLLPDIVSYYYARSDLPTYLRHNYINGIWAILPFRYSAVMPVGWKHLVPLAFALALVSLAVLWLFRVPLSGLLFASVMGSYLTVNVAVSLTVAAGLRRLSLLPALVLGFAALHVPYGLGSIVGVLQTALGLFRLRSR